MNPKILNPNPLIPLNVKIASAKHRRLRRVLDAHDHAPVDEVARQAKAVGTHRIGNSETVCRGGVLLGFWRAFRMLLGPAGINGKRSGHAVGTTLNPKPQDVDFT